MNAIYAQARFRQRAVSSASSTAAKRASLRCKLGSERSERSSRRKHSEVFQKSKFGLKDILTMKKDPRSCSMNMSVHASSLFKVKTLLNQMEEKF